MGAGSCRIEVCRKKERKVGNGRSTDLGGLVLAQHQTVSSWLFARVVFFPNRHCAKCFFPVVCGVRYPAMPIMAKGRKSKIPIIASPQTSPSQKVFLPQFVLKSSCNISTLSLHSPASGEASE